MGWTGFTKRLGVAAATRSTPSAPLDRTAVLGRTVLGKYEVTQLIGEGSNGEVYLARVKTDPGRYVVVKRVKQSLIDNPRFEQFFTAEVQSMRRFRHPYVVELEDASLTDPIGPCMVIEYVHGVTLEAVLQRYPRWYPERLARLLGHLCHALQAAHAAGIVHRDLKPANLMVTGFNTPAESLKVMDFGFAGFTERPHVQIAELTGHGPIFACGTPVYVSPEMVRGDSVDGRADLYAVGVILYEMLTGRVPFEYPRVEDILAAHVKHAPPRFGKIGVADVSAAVEGVVQHVLAKFPNERPQTGKELAQAFGRAIGADVWTASAPPGYETDSLPAAPTERMVDCTLTDTPRQPPTPADRFAVAERFDAQLSPKLAAVKLRGFVEDVGGEVLESEPGLIRMRVAVPHGYQEGQTRSAVFAWLSSIRKPSVRDGEEPIDVALGLRNLDTTRVQVDVTYKPLPDFLPRDRGQWQQRCEQMNNVLRMYLMASG